MHGLSVHRCGALKPENGFEWTVGRGELGRYLVNYAREHPEVCEIPHKLRGAIGNGLRPEVWDDFQDKFNIPVVVEPEAQVEPVPFSFIAPQMRLDGSGWPA